MSRIGSKPVEIPANAKYKVEGDVFYAEGPKGKLEVKIPGDIEVKIGEKDIVCMRKNNSKIARANHGLIRNLINNSLVGVTAGYSRSLDIHGVGFKGQMKGKKVVFSLGYSHDIDFDIPAGVSITLPNPTNVVIESCDKVKVGQVAATIRSFYKPEPYKGKGVRYSGENIRRKQGKVVG